MDSSWDTIIVGAGIAGACAATFCTGQGRTLLIEADGPAAGASGASAGLVNSFMGRRARPVWRREQAMEALRETLTVGRARKFFFNTGVLRIPRDDSQAETYRERHTRHPDETDWLAPGAVEERYPDLKAPRGGLLVRSGGFVQVPKAVRRLLQTAGARGLQLLAPARVDSWNEDERGPYVIVDQHTRLYGRRIILAVGAGFDRFPELRRLNLRGVKGQTVTIRRPRHLGSIPCVSGHGYIAPDGDRLILGSTYEHSFTDAHPRSKDTATIFRKVSNMISLEGTEIVAERAGIRVMTPHTNKAMVGPLPDYENIWFFGGLGSKGLLTAPMMARNLPRWLHSPEDIPPRLRPDSTRTTQ